MEKTTDRALGNRATAPERTSASFVVAAVAGPLLLVVPVGYLALQLQASEAHAFLGFDSRPVGIEGDWLPYVWRLSLILLVVFAVMGYRRAIRGTSARIAALAILAAIIASSTVASVPRMTEEQYPLLLQIVVEGAKSPLILALLGVVIADVMDSRRRTQAH